FYGMVVIEEGAVGGPFDGGPDLTTDLGEDEEADIVILGFYALPIFRYRVVGEAVIAEIRIHVVEQANRVRVREAVGWEYLFVFADRRGLLCVGGQQGGDEDASNDISVRGHHLF